MYYVYIIQSKSTAKYYTGFTNNVRRRLDEHNRNYSNTLFTSNLTDFELVFCQLVDSSTEARELEKYLKSGVGREIRKEILKITSGGL